MDEARRLVEAEVVAHRDRLRAFIYTLVGRQEAVDDIFQEVYLVLSAKAADYRPGTSFLAWARAVARFCALRRLAEDRRRQRLDPATIELLAAAADEEEPDRYDRERAALAGCLERLSPAARALLRQRYEEGLLPAAIAARVRRTVNAVSVQLAKVRAALRDCVQRRLGGAEP